MLINEDLSFEESVGIPFELLYSKKLSRKAKLLFLYLRSFDVWDSRFPTFGALEDLTGFGHSTLSRALKELKGAGILSTMKGRNLTPYRSSCYILNSPEKWVLTEEKIS